jgi:hypothetical protein
MSEDPIILRESDDNVRAAEGIVVSLSDIGKSHSRLIFDDVAVVSVAEHRMWRHKSFHTCNDYENTLLNEMALTDDQYRDIGIALVARLLAISGRAR